MIINDGEANKIKTTANRIKRLKKKKQERRNNCKI